MIVGYFKNLAIHTSWLLGVNCHHERRLGIINIEIRLRVLLLFWMSGGARVLGRQLPGLCVLEYLTERLIIFV
jgi:hypothetical protein